MSRYQITNEWGRHNRGPVFVRRRRFNWFGVVCAAIMVVIAGSWFVNNNDDAPAVVNNEKLDVGGSGTGGAIEEVLSGKVLSIPISGQEVIDSTGSGEADIAQSTKDVKVNAKSMEAILASETGRQGSGTATSSFLDGEFQHIVVSNLPDPGAGYFYEVWLIRSKPFDFFSTGRLIQHADDLKWYLIYSGKEDKTDFLKVVVTIEKDDRNAAPGEHILEGILK
ncbi:MAG: anti-sigma factor [Patescibacteria group bacterium]